MRRSDFQAAMPHRSLPEATRANGYETLEGGRELQCPLLMSVNAKHEEDHAKQSAH
jgi:hypothetical protein